MEKSNFADPEKRTHATRGIKPVLLFALALINLLINSAIYALDLNATLGKPFAKLKPSGNFTWVDGRRASYIEAPIINLQEDQYLVRKTISFGKILKWHDGTVCTNWELLPNHIYSAFVEDPLLSDTQQLGSSHPPTLRLRNQGYQVICEGIAIGSLTDIDGRTLIVPMYNSAINGLFEKPVDRTVMLEMARKLKQQEFISITPYMISSNEFRKALSDYVSESGGYNLKFYRSPITRNLMHELIESPTLRKRLNLDLIE